MSYLREKELGAATISYATTLGVQVLESAYETSKFRIRSITSSKSGLFLRKGANVPAARLYWIVSNVCAEKSNALIGSQCIRQNLGVRWRTSSTVNPRRKDSSIRHSPRAIVAGSR